MIGLLLTTVVICLMALVYKRWLDVKSYWVQRGVPYPPPHPVFGSLTFLQKMNPAVFMREIYDRFEAPYVGIWLFWRPALVVNCPEISHRILVKDSAVFRDRFLSSASHDPFGNLNIFTAKEPLWSKVRRRLTPAFTSSKLKGVQILMNDKSKDLVQRIAKESKKGKFNYKAVYTDYTSDVIGTASLGVHSDATSTGSSPIREITKDFERYSLLRGIAWSCIFFFPELVGPFRFTFFPKAATDYFRKIFDAMVKIRKEQRTHDSEPRDLLDILLKMKKDMILDNEEILDDVLISQAAIFIQGGFDTTGTQVAFATYELAHHPEIQERVYKELKEAKERNNDADFNESTLANLAYLNCVLKESVRKYPPMGWLDRIASNDYKIDDNLTIPAGTPVYVNGVGMNYDPKFYPEPTRFNPDRYLPENEANIIKYVSLGFGDGPRGCIGQRFAYASMRTALTAIVLNYQLKPYPNTPKPNEVKIEKNGMFIGPGEVMFVEFIPRK